MLIVKTRIKLFLEQKWYSLSSFFFSTSSFSSVQLLSRILLFGTPWTAPHQASLSITIFWSLLKLMSIKLVMPSNHLTLWCPRLLLPSVFCSIRVFSKESVLPIRWPKYLELQLQVWPTGMDNIYDSVLWTVCHKQS